MKTNKSLIVIQIEFEAWNNTTFWTILWCSTSSSSSSSFSLLTLPVWVLRLLSVANPFPQMLQWNGRFFNRSIWDSWFRRCCCRLDSWMKARPHSGMWHLYGRSPAPQFFLFYSCKIKWVWCVMMPIARMIYFHILLTFVIVKIETSQCLANFQNQPKLDLQQNSFGFLYVSRLPASFPLSMLHSLSLSKLSLAPSLIIYLKKNFYWKPPWQCWVFLQTKYDKHEKY